MDNTRLRYLQDIQDSLQQIDDLAKKAEQSLSRVEQTETDLPDASFSRYYAARGVRAEYGRIQIKAEEARQLAVTASSETNESSLLQLKQSIDGLRSAVLASASNLKTSAARYSDTVDQANTIKTPNQSKQVAARVTELSENADRLSQNIKFTTQIANRLVAKGEDASESFDIVKRLTSQLAKIRYTISSEERARQTFNPTIPIKKQSVDVIRYVVEKPRAEPLVQQINSRLVRMPINPAFAPREVNPV
jgi:predicted  nucleic acid-binding Zn-ribbon protein